MIYILWLELYKFLLTLFSFWVWFIEIINAIILSRLLKIFRFLTILSICLLYYLFISLLLLILHLDLILLLLLLLLLAFTFNDESYNSSPYLNCNFILSNRNWGFHFYKCSKFRIIVSNNKITIFKFYKSMFSWNRYITYSYITFVTSSQFCFQLLIIMGLN